MGEKKLPPSADLKRSLVELGDPELSVRQRCELLGLSLLSLYCEPAGESPEDLRLMRRIDEPYTACPSTAAGGCRPSGSSQGGGEPEAGAAADAGHHHEPFLTDSPTRSVHRLVQMIGTGRVSTHLLAVYDF